MRMFESGGNSSSPRRARSTIALIAVALVVIAIIGVMFSACGGTLGGTTTTAAQAPGNTQQAAPAGQATAAGQATTATTSQLPPASQGDTSPATPVAQTLGPSVVNIKVTGTTSGNSNQFGFGGQFGQGPQQYAAEGSGVIYKSDGYIITNNHVVTDETGSNPVSAIKVTLATGEQLDGKLIGRDPLSDLAVVKVDKTGLPAAKFVAGVPTVGEYAIAIGSPLGYENSVTLGIISGVGRTIQGVTGAEGIALSNLIQTDAPISPGNSGGALANSKGEVIGINVAYESPQGGAVSIGFAIPSTTAASVADQLISGGKVTHAYMGVSTQAITSELQKQYNLSRASGLLVAEVASGSPAEKAGIKQGDIIVKVNGTDVTDPGALAATIRDMKPGDQVQVVIDRNGQSQTVTVTLAERPANV